MRIEVLEAISRLLRLIIAVIALTIAYLLYLSWRGGTDIPTPLQSETPNPVPTHTPTPTQPPRPRIGIVAGHWRYDSGAICDDGVREVDINLAIARQVVTILRQKGYETDLLEEFDPRTKGYVGDAFVSLHADSCIAEPIATGFKVARSATSAIPETEDRLIECLYEEYEKATGLPRHESSITSNMVHYHGLNEIAPRTPGAIIEMGFISNDRGILLQGKDKAAQGIVNGILCFLGEETVPSPSPTP